MFNKYRSIFEESSLRIPGIRVSGAEVKSGDVYVEAFECPALGQDAELEKLYTDALIWLDVELFCKGELYTVYRVPNIGVYLVIWSYKLFTR